MNTPFKHYHAYHKGLDKAKEWGLEAEFINELLRLLMEYNFKGDIDNAVNSALTEWDISTQGIKKGDTNKYTKAIKLAANLDCYLDPNEASKISDKHGVSFLVALRDIKSYRKSLNKGKNKGRGIDKRR